MLPALKPDIVPCTPAAKLQHRCILTMGSHIFGIVSYAAGRMLCSCIANRLKPPAAQARDLQAALRGEAAQLETFIPVLIQGAASGIADALKQQVRRIAHLQTLNICRHCIQELKQSPETMQWQRL
jgi:hypothetical protein